MNVRRNNLIYQKQNYKYNRKKEEKEYGKETI